MIEREFARWLSPGGGKGGAASQSFDAIVMIGANAGKAIVKRVPARRDMPALRMAESVHGLAASNDAEAAPGSDRDTSPRHAAQPGRAPGWDRVWESR